MVMKWSVVATHETFMAASYLNEERLTMDRLNIGALAHQTNTEHEKGRGRQPSTSNEAVKHVLECSQQLIISDSVPQMYPAKQPQCFKR